MKQKLSYRIENNVAIFKTRQKERSVEFIVDVSDIDKVNEHVWNYHKFNKGKDSYYLVYRYKDEKGKWKTLSLSRHLGYGKRFTHINGNNLDFRKCNMRYRKPVYDAIAKKLNK